MVGEVFSPSPLSSAIPTTGASVPKTSPTIPSRPPSLPPRLATSKNPGSSPLPRRQPPPIPLPQHIPEKEKTRKRRVRFDSYVLFLQGLRERDLELVQTHIR